MAFHDIIIMIIIGGVFVLLGFVGLFWGRKEEGSYYGSVSERIDVREFLDHSPGRPEPNALRTGGENAIAGGGGLLLLALGFYLWGLKS
jgi:hypothetical protein